MNNLFSFRWTNSSGRRNLPRLKDEVAAELQTKFKNKSTFLTSGISEARNGGHEGMKDITTLEIVLKAFKSVGIKIK